MKAPQRIHKPPTEPHEGWIVEDIFNNSPDDMIYYPINLYRLILNSINIFHIDKNGMTDLEPMYVLNKLNRMIKPDVPNIVADIPNEDYLFINNINKGNKLFSALLKMYLSPKRVIKSLRLTKDAFNYICQKYLCHFRSGSL